MDTTPLTGVDVRRFHVGEAEYEIRSMANDFLNRLSTRNAHPTYGITKGSLHHLASMLEGAVRMYAVLTSQANFWSAPVASAPRFVDSDLNALVAEVILKDRGL